jgi:nucleoside-diphosphate-sugar epimerase
MFGADKKYGEKRIEPQLTLSDINKANQYLDWEPKIKLEEWVQEQL